MAFESKWAYDEDRCYHGFKSADGTRRILVEHSTYGLTERQSPKVLGELTPLDPVVTFHWGYTGSGPNSVAAAILFDALGFEPIVWLRHAFVWDWVGLAGPEFHYRRPAILRWARGLLVQRDVEDVPKVLVELPPVDPDKYARSPETLRAIQERSR